MNKAKEMQARNQVPGEHKLTSINSSGDISEIEDNVGSPV